MAINLSKERINERKESAVFSDEDFVNVNLNNIKENKRIFIPYDELLDSEEMRYSYLESLVSFIERKTGKHCSYFPVNETEPYEVSGFYIQTAPELKDRNGIYVSNNDFIYDKNGVKWHVTYYYKNNQPYILIDNDNSGYVVVSSLSEFTLNPDDDFLKEIPENDNEKIASEDKKSFHFIFAPYQIAVMLMMTAGWLLVLFSNDIADIMADMLMNILKLIPDFQDEEMISNMHSLFKLLLDFEGIAIFMNGGFYCIKKISKNINTKESKQ